MQRGKDYSEKKTSSRATSLNEQLIIRRGKDYAEKESVPRTPLQTNS
jgi:hypothetical protein